MNPLQASAFFFFVVVPHITDAIQDWVTRVSCEPVEKDTNADVCIIEVSEQEKSIIFLHIFILQPHGAKKVIFTACHLGKLKLTFTSPNVISTSLKNVLMRPIDLTVLL